MTKTTPISDPPVIDTSINPYDYVAVQKSKDKFFNEQLIRHEEINVLRDKLRWCYMREGVNHFSKCREFAEEYMEVLRGMKNGRFDPYHKPAPPSAFDKISS